MEEKPVEECKIMDAESLRGSMNRFPRRGFPSNVRTLIGEEPVSLAPHPISILGSILAPYFMENAL